MTVSGRPIRMLADGQWADGAVLTNPTDGAILAQLTGLVAGNYLIAANGSCSVSWVYDIQRQDINATVLHTQRRRLAAGPEDFLFPSWVPVNNDDGFVLILRGAITGEIQMSLWAQLGG